MSKLLQFLGLQKKAAPMPNSPNGFYTMIGGSIIWMADNQLSYIENGYQGNDIVYSIVKKVENKVAIAPFMLYKVTSDSTYKQFRAAIEAKNFQLAERLQRKALEPLASFNARTGKWKELLEWPNENQTLGDLVADQSAFKMITGNSFLYAEKIEGGAREGLPNQLMSLPSQWIQLYIDNKFPAKVTGYKMNYGTLVDFAKEEVMHLKYFNPAYDTNGSHLYGQSPLKAATKTLTRNNSLKKAAAAKFDNSGGAGIVYLDDQRLDSDAAEAQINAIKENWDKNYAGAERYGRVAHSGYKVGYAKIGETAKDMNLVEFEQIDLQRLCGIWGVPSRLLNDPNNQAEANVVESERQLTSNAALPLITSFRDNLNRFAKANWGLDANVVIDFDLSVYRELQEDQKTKWEWVSQLTVPEAYKLEMLGLEVPKELPRDLIIVDGNKQTLDDLINGGAINLP